MLANDVRKLGALVVAAFVSALAVARSTLHYPWYWDDYHLVRRFSASELRAVFTGPWDVDAIESVSYRPMWVVLNHARTALLGENIVLHRLLLLASLAVFVALLGLCAHRAGLAMRYTLLGVCVAVVSKGNHANLLWLTDATHAFSGIPVALCCVLRASSHRPSRIQPAGIFALSLFGLLVREDIAALFPLVVLIGLIVPRDPPERVFPSFLGRMLSQVPTLLALCLSLGVYFWLRQTFVPSAVEGFNLNGLFEHLRMTVDVMGTRTSANTRMAWHLFAGVLLGAGVIAYTESYLRLPLACFASCAILACTPGIVLVRSNLLMVPTTLFAFTLAFGLAAAIERCDSLWLQGVLCALALWFGRQTYIETRESLLAGHPRSVETIQFAADFLYGQFASRATIPADRRAAGEKYLKTFGIDSPESYAQRMPRLLRMAKHRRKPGKDRKPFTPPSLFLDH